MSKSNVENKCISASGYILPEHNPTLFVEQKVKAGTAVIRTETHISNNVILGNKPYTGKYEQLKFIKISFRNRLLVRSSLLHHAGRHSCMPCNRENST